jgi:hypothetical protein
MRSRIELPVRLAAALLASLCLSLAAAAQASPLDDAKARGLVGERADGYVGVVDASAPADVKLLVEDVNKRRAHEYEAIAKRNGTNATAVGALAGAKLVERAAPGQFVMDASGSWKKK